MQKEGLTTEQAPGRYPQWDKIMIRDIMLDKNLGFSSDMRIIVYNCSKTLILRRDSWEVIGEFSVPVKSISEKLFKKPQFFNILNNEGKL